MKIYKKFDLKLILRIGSIIGFIVMLCYYYLRIHTVATQYIYPLDDAYIHLAVAKNVALHQVWGVTQYIFSSSSSSPVFTLVLATAIKIFGNHSILSLWLNIGLVILFLLLLHKQISAYTTKVYFILLNAILWFAPIYIQALSGMEHLLHIVLLLLCLSQFFSGFSTRQYALT